MINLIPRLALPLMLLTAGPTLAHTLPDPMEILSGRPAGADPHDPMTAIVAKADAGKPQAAEQEFDGLPAGAGAEETYYQCVACHSVQIIQQQRVTDHRWDELWRWMVEAQGMAEPDPETKELILAYLKQNFSSQR
ncbi:cytochrome C-552 [Paracoccus laeviglucosivorans]|uniref:Cytochrome c n=1 Tax=Paracoccus laeviglucosivorans TaxID=1197861 RepID=A0A521FQW2_9RHOB|nr:cytochrome C-552 [Paracoccus laeviglucosivorans]SMO98444.1 hypothetical protein SAMN06265221_13412 [Paracoccus laeviglucosivorans]